MVGWYCAKFFQNNSESVYLLGWAGTMSTFFLMPIFLSVFFHFWMVFILLKTVSYSSYLMNTCNMFLNIQKIIIGCLLLQFFKGVPHQQDWSSIVCLVWWSSSVSSFFWSVFFPNPSLLSFSFPLLKLFSFYFLSSILLGISKCLISQNIVQVCLIKTPLKRKQHSHNVSRG